MNAANTWSRVLGFRKQIKREERGEYLVSIRLAAQGREWRGRDHEKLEGARLMRASDGQCPAWEVEKSKELPTGWTYLCFTLMSVSCITHIPETGGRQK